MAENRLASVVAEDVRQVLMRDLPWHEFSGRRLVVTGAAGFLGRYFVHVLLALNDMRKVDRPVTVVGLVRDVERARAVFADVANRADFILQRWDLTQVALPDLGDAAYIIHAASHASPRFYGIDPVGTLLPNTVGTAALLTALSRSGDARGFLFVSSSEVYGAVSEPVALREDRYGVVDPAAVRSCYAEGKRAGEAMCVAWHAQYGVPTFIVRPFHTYGPGLAADDGRVFADFAFNVIRGENIIMKSDGGARRAFCYVSDAMAGFFTILLRGQPAIPYNVANPAGELSVLELAELLVGLAPELGLRVERQSQPNPGYLPSSYNRLIPDIGALTALGWTAGISPEEGFRRMLRAYV